jgi:hypothetical protein
VTHIAHVLQDGAWLGTLGHANSSNFDLII